MFSYGFPRHWSTLRKLLWLKLLQGAAAVVETVTGNAPLTLANAVAKAIKSLTQTGLCAQASTPTPSVPVPIKCNNGELKMVDDELPTGYKRLIGITFDGNIRYTTDEYLTGDDDVTMTLNNISSSGKNLFGSYNGANDKNFSMYIYGSSTSGSYFRYGDQLKRPKYGGTGKRTITFGKSGTSGFAEDSDVTIDEFTTPENTYIGMLPNSSSAAFMGDIVGSILVSNRLEWIPCERESDGVIGYYEKYNGNFIAPTGSGTPVSLGYDTSHMTVLSVVGDAEVLTVSASGAADQTASVVNLFSAGDYKDTQEIIGGTVKRNVGIKVFDGTEEWVAHTVVGTYRYRFEEKKVEKAPFASTHFVYSSKASGEISNGEMMCGAASANAYFRNTDCATLADFTAWLAEQYAAGTPVIVVYPLAEATTESVAGQALHTVAGTNTVSVTAEVSPVALSCEYYQAAA